MKFIEETEKKINWKKLIAALVICLTAAFIGSYFTSSSIEDWYYTLEKPGFTPPNWIFGPVWGVLYILMGVSLYLVWKKGEFRKDVKLAMDVFGVQLVLNILWSFFFFYIQNPLAGFIEIIALWFMILLNVFLFYKISKPAAYLLTPYLMWVAYAANLNLYIWLLN